ncbi:hypothetical protein EO087_05620 [Dyella sp. M7H15-1]|uniref:hypothetical protein n=1 Tax=Dyella sp. M7H15-1 TaxID=2501295 RepID=UPI001005244F|nr:hypothetical protein [Dyella sp. M7H15-1]QAU23527.1 hypothetical protein EO087_05620 [Dyella sp. M7H15-1]
MTTLTEQQAYEAMFYFLDQRYQALKEGALASLLGDMSTLADGGTADPAIDGYWKKAIDFALNGGIASRLQFIPK